MVKAEGGLVVGVVEVGEVRQHLGRSEHPLVDEDLARQGANVERQRFGVARFPNRVRGQFANDEQLAFEGGVVDALRCADEEHLHRGFRSDGGWSDIGPLWISGQRTPADEGLALLSDDGVDLRLELFVIGGILGKEDHTRAIQPLGG